MIILKKLLLSFVVLIYSITALVHSCHSTTILSHGKPYNVSPKPNYRFTAPSTDNEMLTNGKFTVGNFWTQKTTVGWEFTKTTEILIDLEKVSNIGSITFNTARGEYAGVYFPRHIVAFVGPDMEHLKYVGDIADNSKNIPGAYQVNRFHLDGIAEKGRYVLLVVQPKGTYLFCDEIEVLEGESDTGVVGHLNKKGALDLYNQIIWFDDYREFVKGAAAEFKSEINANPELSVHLAIISKRIHSFESVEDVGAVKAEILNLRKEFQAARFPDKNVLIEVINPWLPLSTVSLPLDRSNLKLSLNLLQGGYDHAAFTITNLSQNLQQVDLNVEQMPKEAPELLMYEVPFVKSAAIEFVADPLVQVNGPVSLGPGETKMVFMTVKGDKAGAWQTSLKVSSAAAVDFLPVDIQVSSLIFPKDFSLNSVNWAYLDFSLIADRKNEAVKDLFAHHINTIVVPPAYLPIYGPASDPYFFGLEKYLKLHKGAMKVLLFVDFGNSLRATVNGKYTFMGSDWQTWFRKWYAGAVLAAKRAGFLENQLFLYPYDEMGGQRIDDFIRFATWVKLEIPSVKNYATLGDATFKSKRWGEILPFLDIAQTSYEEMLRDRRLFKGQAWIYDTAGMSRSLSPYSYYRMMSWKAFVRGYTGIGFWAYADTGSDVTAWKELDRDFAVIYEGKDNGIVSSRRWEAWRMGIEDYELLTMYAKLRGRQEATELAKDVLDHPEDTERADSVRRRILYEISGLQPPPPTRARRVY
ncbi:MAG: DUF4091 domain-containing protein [Desulfuromonadales bacterium]|nr:DUF4091 domain-containing protein [Desulfuromonadales bacterium]